MHEPALRRAEAVDVLRWAAHPELDELVTVPSQRGVILECLQELVRHRQVDDAM
ncbi:MAG: hypothetical protein H0V23_11625, partial [Nocardioidaceae bacterium]|nr:hypothetical protein [Nocardioidaceae bacterium]